MGDPGVENTRQMSGIPDVENTRHMNGRPPDARNCDCNICGALAQSEKSLK